MKLTVNTVIEWIENESGNLTERILDIDTNNNLIATIDIFSESALPMIRNYSQINGAFNNKILRTLEKDPFQTQFISEEDIPEKYREKRDRSWAYVSEVIALGFDAFNPKKRGIALAEIGKKYRKGKKDIYKKLRRYWQKGMTKNTLLPYYWKCGLRGERKLGKETTDQKLGRKKTSEVTTGETTGIRITPEIEKYFERGTRRHYENKKTSLRLAYQKTLEDFFHEGYEPFLFKEKSIRVPILPDVKYLPTFEQFRYWHEQIYRDPVRQTKKRLGETAYNLRHRELIGNSTDMAFGPGSVYQIDATIADLYLVSSFNRSLIIGRPVVYIVIDVFSRMIVGFAVTLSNRT